VDDTAHGTIVYYSQAGGPPPSIDPNLLMADSKVLVGGELWSHISDRESLLNRSETLFSWVNSGKISLMELTKYSLSRTADAHEALESGKLKVRLY
jgi:NADPH2:quinone reductase